MSYYLFIDGAYFHAAYESAMQQFFGEVPPINYAELSAKFDSPRRVYFYDAVDRSKHATESEEQRDSRVKERDDLHAYLNSIPLWHVREGFVSRARSVKRRAQKAVDVQLAVDALEHAIAQNMKHAAFLLGDLDFEPLLVSLNRLGVETTVWYERGTTSPELLKTADVRRQLRMQNFYSFACDEFQRDHFVAAVLLGAPSPQLPAKRKGEWQGRPIELSKASDGSLRLWAKAGPDPHRQPSVLVDYRGGDVEKLELALVMSEGGHIIWDA